MNNFKVKRACALVVAFMLNVPALAANPDALYGQWGTKAQCEGALITPKGTKRATPFKIKPDWLEHGDVWCRLTWSRVSTTSNGVTGVAWSLCGEDSVRGYFITFNLIGDELSLIWNQQFQNGPLMSCDISKKTR